eukprot:scaffold46063_cov33-Cyclotella_meneghiniana.AAC.2
MAAGYGRLNGEEWKVDNRKGVRPYSVGVYSRHDSVGIDDNDVRCRLVICCCCVVNDEAMVMLGGVERLIVMVE